MQLPANVTLADANIVLDSLQVALADGSGPLHIDASALTSFDTSAVALLLHARRAARVAGRPFQILGAPAKLAELARLYGVEELLALTSLTQPPPGGGAAPADRHR